MGSYSTLTFRIGKILSPLKLSFTKMIELSEYIEKNQDSILKEITHQISENSSFIVKKSTENLRRENLEGLAIIFPALIIKNATFENRMKSSITICIDPHHSKLWNSFYHEGSFEISEIEEFHKIAIEISLKAHRIILNFFNNELIELNLKPIEEKSRIEILVLGTKDENVLELSNALKENRELKFREAMDKSSYFEAIKDFLSEVYKSKIDTFNDFLINFEKNGVQWFTLEDEIGLFGIFSKSVRHERNAITFLGLIHENPNLYPSLASRRISSALIENFAPSL